MKVKELKEILENLDDDLDIILSSDAEGNGYNHLRWCEQYHYVPHKVKGSGLVDEVIDFDDEDDIGVFTSEELEDLKSRAVNCLTLWP